MEFHYGIFENQLLVTKKIQIKTENLHKTYLYISFNKIPKSHLINLIYFSHYNQDLIHYDLLSVATININNSTQINYNIIKPIPHTKRKHNSPPLPYITYGNKRHIAFAIHSHIFAPHSKHYSLIQVEVRSRQRKAGVSLI